MKKVKTQYGSLNPVKSQKQDLQKQKPYWVEHPLGQTCLKRVRRNIHLGLVGLSAGKGEIRGMLLMLRMFNSGKI